MKKSTNQNTYVTYSMYLCISRSHVLVDTWFMILNSLIYKYLKPNLTHNPFHLVWVSTLRNYYSCIFRRRFWGFLTKNLVFRMRYTRFVFKKYQDWSCIFQGRNKQWMKLLFTFIFRLLTVAKSMSTVVPHLGSLLSYYQDGFGNE